MLASVAMACPGEKEFGKSITVSLAVADATALKAYPGKIVSYELENETGGSGLRYSIVVAAGKVKHEVGVDAVTGKLVENALEAKSSD